MKESTFKKATGFLYALIILLLAVMFFTNDFGLVDLRKSSVVIGVGLDADGEDVKLTAQLAVPQPAENGENTKFTTVTGRGKTVACALNEVNVKTGFYPKLVFCKVIVVGESCFERDFNTLLNYFYDNEYNGLTPKLAACKGSAEKLISMQLPLGESATDSIDRLLSDEAKKSGNASSVNLKDFGQGYFTKSEAAYMPYIETGEEVAGETGGQSGSSGGVQSEGGNKPVEFISEKTAAFSHGRFCGLLEKEQAFALNLLKNDIRHAYTDCGGAKSAVVGLRNCKGGASIKLEKGQPVLKLGFSATAKLIDGERESGRKQDGDKRTPEEVLRDGEKSIGEKFEMLYAFIRESGCDLLGVRDMIYKYHTDSFENLKDDVWDKLRLDIDVKLKSAG